MQLVLLVSDCILHDEMVNWHSVWLRNYDAISYMELCLHYTTVSCVICTPHLAISIWHKYACSLSNVLMFDHHYLQFCTLTSTPPVSYFLSLLWPELSLQWQSGHYFWGCMEVYRTDWCIHFQQAIRHLFVTHLFWIQQFERLKLSNI